MVGQAMNGDPEKIQVTSRSSITQFQFSTCTFFLSRSLYHIFFFSLSFLKGSSSTFSLEFLYYSLQPTPVILPGGFYRQRSLAGYSPWGCKESSMTEQLSLNIFSIMGLRVQLERLYSNDILFLVGSLHFKRRCGHSVHLASLPSGHLIR